MNMNMNVNYGENESNETLVVVTRLCSRKKYDIVADQIKFLSIRHLHLSHNRRLSDQINVDNNLHEKDEISKGI